MKKHYFITPNYSVGINPKVGTSTLSRAIVKSFYPDKEYLVQTAAYPEGKGPDNTAIHFLCPQESTPPSNPVVLIVRDPIARFRSAMAQMNLTDVEQALDSLENETLVQFREKSRTLRDDPHFKHQHELVFGPTKIFKFEDIEAAAAYIGLELPLPTINSAKRTKPTLTEKQEQRLLAYYSEDDALYSNCPDGGYTYNP